LILTIIHPHSHHHSPTPGLTNNHAKPCRGRTRMAYREVRMMDIDQVIRRWLGRGKYPGRRALDRFGSEHGATADPFGSASWSETRRRVARRRKASEHTGASGSAGCRAGAGADRTGIASAAAAD